MAYIYRHFHEGTLSLGLTNSSLLLYIIIGLHCRIGFIYVK
jgi:hypothetical protein